MAITYQPGKFAAFLQKKDWNQLTQEICTSLIGAGIGLYCYEKEVFRGPFQFLQKLGIGNSLPSNPITSETTRPFLNFGLGMIVVCILIKLAIYATIINVNSWKSGGTRSQRAKSFDLNGVIQELMTALLGVIVGLYTTPIVKNAIIFEKAEYPDPTVGVVLVLLCLIFKICVYSEALNFNVFVQRSKRSLWSPGKISPFLRKYDWNVVLQEFCSVCIGIGLGLYLYESQIVFLADKIVPGFSQKVEQQSDSFFRRIFSGVEKRTGTKIDWKPQILSNKEAKPYIVTGIVVVALCVVLKLLMYMSLWDANSLRYFLVGGSPPGFTRKGYSEMFEELTTLALTTVFGIITTPVVKNSFMQQKQQYDISWLWWGLLVFLIWLKLSLIVGAISFSQRSKRRR